MATFDEYLAAEKEFRRLQRELVEEQRAADFKVERPLVPTVKFVMAQPGVMIITSAKDGLRLVVEGNALG